VGKLHILRLQISCSVYVPKKWKLDDSRQSYCKNYLAYFFGPPCILYSLSWSLKVTGHPVCHCALINIRNSFRSHDKPTCLLHCNSSLPLQWTSRFTGHHNAQCSAWERTKLVHKTLTSSPLDETRERFPHSLHQDLIMTKRVLLLTRDALEHSAALRLHVVRPTVCPSVCLLVAHDHISWKSWKLIARSISPTHSLFADQRPST